MSKREKRIIDAFINCVKHGEFTEDYAVILIEDTSKYGWLSQAAKDSFYEAIEPEETPAEEAPAEEATEEPEETPNEA